MVTKTSTTDGRIPPVTKQNTYMGYTTSGEWAGSQGTDYSNQVVHGGSLPEYRELIRNRQSATTSLHGVMYKARIARSEFAQLRWKNTGNQEISTVNFLGPISITGAHHVVGPPDGDLVDSVRDEARKKFMSRCREAQRSTQALVSLGEIGELVRMIRNPLKKLFSENYDYLHTVGKRLRRNRNKKSNRQWRQETIADTWLEYSFGWQPVVNDIFSTCEALARAEYNPPYKRVNASVHRNKNQQWSHTIQLDAYHALSQSGQIADMTAYRYSGCVAVAESPTASTDGLGLSLKDLLPTLWELIPYSFAIDYFSNVGAIIEAASFRRSDIKWIEEGRKLSREITHYPSKFTQNSDAQWTALGADNRTRPSEMSYKSVSRENFTGTLVPPLKFKIPGSTMQWCNITALLAASSDASRRAARL